MAYNFSRLYDRRYRALVINDKDPEFKMRVKVRIPDLMVAGTKYVGNWDENGLWAFPANNCMGGRNIQDTKIRMQAESGYYQGSCFIPPKGSHVWVWFENNDPSHPFYGPAAEYGDTLALPENQLGKEYQKKWTLYKSQQGRCIIISDDDSDARVEITGKKRKIKNPPFGDTDSVYEIDGNQSVFLIDERPKHEKILLKDYRGNFFKLIQDENGIQDQFHGKIQDDVHLEIDKDFYLTVHGNFHLKVDKDIYVQSLQNIYVKATNKLKENAESFDRYSQLYDNTYSGAINIKSGSNINMDASFDIFQHSIRNIRNSMITSDVSTATTTIMAGGAIGIKAGGEVSIVGDAGVTQQSTPIVNPLYGDTKTALIAPRATKSNPDEKRYQDQEFVGKAPILTLPVNDDSLESLSFDHAPKQIAQCNCSQVKGSQISQSPNQSSGSSSCSGASGSSSSSSSQITSSEKSQPTPEKPKPKTLKDIIKKTVSDSLSKYVDADKFTEKLKNAVKNVSDAINNKLSSKLVGQGTDIYKDAPNKALSEINSGLASSCSYSSNLTEQKPPTVSVARKMFSTFADTISTIDFVTSEVSSAITTNIYVEPPSTSLICDPISSITLPSIGGSINSGFNPICNAADMVCGNNFDVLGNCQPVTYIDPEPDIFGNHVRTSIGGTSVGPEDVISVIGGLISSICNSSSDKISNDLNSDLNETSESVVTDLDYIDPEAVSNAADNEINASYNDAQENVEESNESVLGNIVACADFISGIFQKTMLTIDSCNMIINQAFDSLESFIYETESPDFLNTYSSNPGIVDQRTSEILSVLVAAISTSGMSVDDRKVVLTACGTKLGLILSDELSSVFSSSDMGGSKTSIFGNLIDNVKAAVSIPLILSNFLHDASFGIGNLVGNFAFRCQNLISGVLSLVFNNAFSAIFNSIRSRDQRYVDNDGYVIIDNVCNDLDTIYRDMHTDMQDMTFREFVGEENFNSLQQSLQSEVDQFKSSLSEVYPTENNIDNKLEEISEQLSDKINEERKESLDQIIEIKFTQDNEFSKLYPIKNVIPDTVGCGYINLLFLADKYRKTVLPILINDGCNCVAFSLVTNTNNFKVTKKFSLKDPVPQKEDDVNTTISFEDGTTEESSSDSILIFDGNKEINEDDINPVEEDFMIDDEAVQSFDQMFNSLNKEINNDSYVIDTTTKWWQNLGEVLTQASINNMVVLITLQDFNDPENPFIKDVEESDRYLDSMWRKNIEEKFYKTLLDFIKETQAKVILNFGYGCYENQSDPKNEKYTMYPTCGYLRRMVNYFVYICGYTSNWMAMTANEKQNLYYFNPYCEWYAFDDEEEHILKNLQLLSLDCVDGYMNDGANCVTYDDQSNINGGYAKIICNSEKYSIPVFHMINLKEKIIELGLSDMAHDPNVMKKILCPNSRKAIRYFKTDDYFDKNRPEIEFDENGEVI